MAKTIANSVFDAGLNFIKNNANEMILLDAAPADRAAAVANSLATFSMVTGDYTVSDGASGRKVVVGAKSGGTGIGGGGNHNHTALISATELLVVTESAATKSINDGDAINTQSFEFTINDPT